MMDLYILDMVRDHGGRLQIDQEIVDRNIALILAAIDSGKLGDVSLYDKNTHIYDIGKNINFFSIYQKNKDIFKENDFYKKSLRTLMLK